jgi:hypothetical protein
MVVGFKTTCAISAYHHQSWEIPKGKSKMDNLEKQAAWGIQEEEKQNKSTTQ